MIFGPRAGDGVALITAEGTVLWDADKAGKTGTAVEALMHSATLAKRYASPCFRVHSLAQSLGCVRWCTSHCAVPPLRLSDRNIAFEPLPILEAIQAIKAAGGKAVVAHIPTLGKDWREKFGPKYAAICHICAHCIILLIFPT